MTLNQSLAFEARKEQKVVLDSVEDGKKTTLTFYSVHVPSWIGTESNAAATPGAHDSTGVAGTTAGPIATSNSKWEDIARKAKIPVGKIDVGKRPTDYKATFPSIFLNKARVREAEGGTRIQISCKAANGDTMVSYKVPAGTPPGSISGIFDSKDAAPALRASDKGAESPSEQSFSVEGDAKKFPIVEAWLGLQDFCIMLLEMRQLFLNELRNEMVEKFDAARIAQITREVAGDLKSEISGSSEPTSPTAPITSIRIFNIGNGPANSNLSVELKNVVARGRCLGTSFKTNPKVFASQQPVVAIVDLKNPRYTKIRCFSFFEGKIIPVVEIAEPTDYDQCNDNTEKGGDDRQSFFPALLDSIVGFINQVAGAPPVDDIPFRMILGSLDATAGSSDGSGAAPPSAGSSSTVTEQNVKSLCRRLTEDYLLAVRDDDITCDDCLFKYTKDLRVNDKTGDIGMEKDHNDSTPSDTIGEKSGWNPEPISPNSHSAYPRESDGA